MPALPSKASRRKGVIPARKLNQQDVWSNTLEALGFEALNSPASSKAATLALPAMTSTSASTKLHIEELPHEILKSIFKHSRIADLLALSLVSKHFRDVAAEHLYRRFAIVFPDEEEILDDSQIDALASGLDTFATSDYNYAQYLREIVLETVVGGESRERTYRHYLYDTSCGKFMNTLLLLTLRKAKSLESFRWDIRVELSRQVFKVLYNIQSLQHLHLRMQAGPSIHQSPQPTQQSSIPPSPASTSYISIPHGQSSAGTHMHPVSINMWGDGNKPSFKTQSDTLSKLPPSNKMLLPTLSGFKTLKSLSILDMDTLDYIDELNKCVRNCSSSLKTLKLSFSEALANKSRKPPPDPQSDDDSDQEEEFGQLGGMPPGPPLPNPLAGASDPNGPTRALKAAEEKKKQEAVLGRIFGIEPPSSKPKTPKVNQPSSEKGKDKAPSLEDPKKRFIRNLAPVAAKLMGNINSNKDLTTDGQETLAMIKRAAELYLATSDNEQPGKETPPSSPASDETEVVVMTGGASNEPGLFDKPEAKKKVPTSEPGISNPDDIDIEEPEGTELDIEGPSEVPDVPEEIMEDPKVDQRNATTERWSTKLDLLKQALALKTTHDEMLRTNTKRLDTLGELRGNNMTTSLAPKDWADINRLSAECDSSSAQILELSQRIDLIHNQIEQLDSQISGQYQSLSIENGKMSEYVRSTHGLALESLSIYLIPIKASILSRTLDLSVLQKITLLNVGPQGPFWNLLAKENQMSPLPLCKIHTDNVTLQFLALTAQLDKITELYLIERDPKIARVESTAARTMVSIEHIRRMALKKHASNLKVLLIRNSCNADWDVNDKTVLLLCRRGKQIEELAVSFGMPAMHVLLQHLPGLSSLRVLHALRIRFDDQCPFVPTQFRKFIIDIVTLYPEMKLEYLATDNSINRLVRPKPKAKVDKKGKGKAAEIDVDEATSKLLAKFTLTSSNSLVNLSPTSTTSGWTDAVSNSSTDGGLALGDLMDSSEDEDEQVSGKTGAKLQTMEGIRYCDVPDVKIWVRDIVYCRL